MSIVYDYLKKIHDQKEPEKVTPEVPPVKKSVGSPLWGKVAAGILGCLLLGAGLYVFLPKFEKTTIKLPQIPEKSRAAQTGAPDFRFLLEGIIYNPSRPFAIINGKMFEVGGQIGDFEVEKITPDTVSLKNLKDNTSRTVHL
jgi:hypothetical protein